MKRKGIRIALVVIEAFIGLGAVGGGIAILTGAFDLWLQGTPFSSPTIPSLLLLIVVGTGMLLAAVTQFIQREWTVLLSEKMGMVMIGWEIVEVAITDQYEQAIVPSTVVQQILFSAPGLLIFGLAAYLWMKGYRSHGFLTSHA